MSVNARDLKKTWSILAFSHQFNDLQMKSVVLKLKYIVGLDLAKQCMLYGVIYKHSPADKQGGRGSSKSRHMFWFFPSLANCACGQEVQRKDCRSCCVNQVFVEY